MYHHFQGELFSLDANNAVIDCAGVGYSLCVSGQTAAYLSDKVHNKVLLYSYLQVREDAMELYGFAKKEELDAFRQLIGVSGVGPKAAVSILSVLTVTQLAQAIATEDAKLISRAPGVGAKTAARVVLDLKDKFGAAIPAASDAVPIVAPKDPTAQAEALNALLVLGFSRSQAQEALRHTTAAAVEEMITQALKFLTN